MRIFSILISSLFMAVVVLGLSGVAYAECPSSESNVSAAQYLSDCSQNTSGVEVNANASKHETKAIVKKVAERAIQFGALIAIGAIVFAGIQYTTSYGNDEKIKTAKMTGIYALIGLVLLLTAFVLVDVIIKFIYDLGT